MSHYSTCIHKYILLFLDDKRDAEKTKTCNEPDDLLRVDSDVESELLSYLCDVAVVLPVDQNQVTQIIRQNISRTVPVEVISNLLQKFATQNLIR